MVKSSNPSRRGSQFVVLDVFETGDVIWALDRECSRIGLSMKYMDTPAREQTQPMLDRLREIHDRLEKRYKAHIAKVMSDASRNEGAGNGR